MRTDDDYLMMVPGRNCRKENENVTGRYRNYDPQVTGRFYKAGWFFKMFSTKK